MNVEEYPDYIESLEYQLEMINFVAVEYEKKLKQLMSETDYKEFIKSISDMLIKKDIKNMKDSEFKNFLLQLYNNRKKK